MRENIEQIESKVENSGLYLGKDENGHLTILELKSLKAGTSAVKQLLRYVNNFKEAVYKEMEYCKEITIEDYIFNEFIDILFEFGFSFE